MIRCNLIFLLFLPVILKLQALLVDDCWQFVVAIFLLSLFFFTSLRSTIVIQSFLLSPVVLFLPLLSLYYTLVLRLDYSIFHCLFLLVQLALRMFFIFALPDRNFVELRTVALDLALLSQAVIGGVERSSIIEDGPI